MKFKIYDRYVSSISNIHLNVGECYKSEGTVYTRHGVLI